MVNLNCPVFQSCLIAAIGGILILLRCYRSGQGSILIAATWIYLCATPAFVEIMRRGLESNYPFLTASAYPPVDAIVIFGGDEMPRPNYSWQDETAKISQNRLGFGYQLYRSGLAPIMVLSANKGGAIKMAGILEAKHLPPTALRIESRANSTYENALYSTRILKQENLSRVLLVTSAFHMKRALAVLRHQGIIAIPAPTMPQLIPITIGNGWVPHHLELRRSQVYLHEYLGLLVYQFFGRA